MHPDAEAFTVSKGLKMKWKGIFDFTDLYKKMKFWLDFQGYGDEKSVFKEEKYIERIKGDAKNLEIKWRGEKKVSDYFSFVISLTFLVLGMKEIEVESEGRKLPMNKGEVEIKFTAELIKNRQGKWKKDSWGKKFYERFVVRDRIEDYKIELYKKLYSFHDEVKAYLEIHEF